jgi:hypothetical protein
MAFKITVVCKIWRVKALQLSAHDENGSMKYRLRKPWAISFRRLRKQPVFTELRNDQLTGEKNLVDKNKYKDFILKTLSSIWRMLHLS